MHQWKSNIKGLLHRSGGDSTLMAWEEGALEMEYSEPIGSISWVEHCEGGFITAFGIFEEQVYLIAQFEEWNGETLTPTKLVSYLFE